jgi:crotonobetainyl-CoA:carnitine CoA-transferase CaiB-like acyl-CoA transferase
VKRALENPFVEEVGMVRNVPHPLLPALRLLANPLKVDGVRPDQKVCPPLGADNESVLGGLMPNAGVPG